MQCVCKFASSLYVGGRRKWLEIKAAIAFFGRVDGNQLSGKVGNIHLQIGYARLRRLALELPDQLTSLGSSTSS